MKPGEHADHPLIKELYRMKTADASRAVNCLLNAFRFRGLSSNLYDLTRMQRMELLKIRNVGPQTLLAIGQALQNLDLIQSGKEWATVPKVFNPNINHRTLNKKLDEILAILKGQKP